MLRISFILDKIRRMASSLFAAVVPDSHQFKCKLRCLLALYKPFDLKKPTENRLIAYYADGSPDCPGLADRLKAMVSGYIVAAENNYKYYIYHQLGFDIQEYLIPNEVDWRIETKDICLGLNHVRFLWFTRHMTSLNKKHSEYHIHYAQDVTENLTEEEKKSYGFFQIFHKLFKPTEHLQQLIRNTQNSLNIQENQYIAIHIRFLDFFERVESKRDTAFTRHASPEEQEEMIRSIHQTIDKIHSESNGLPIILFSDSNKFLNLPHEPYIRIIPGEVGHIFSKEGVKKITDRAFLDMFIIAGAKYVYNIVGPGTYTSGYSYMGARIGNKPFSRIPRIQA